MFFLEDCRFFIMVDEVWGFEVEDLCWLLLLLREDRGDRFLIMVDDVWGLVVFLRLEDEDEDLLLLVLERLDLLLRWLDLEDIEELFVVEEWDFVREYVIIRELFIVEIFRGVVRKVGKFLVSYFFIFFVKSFLILLLLFLLFGRFVVIGEGCR